MQFKINVSETAKGFANMGPGVIYINRTSNMITFPDDDESEANGNKLDYDSSTDYEYSHYGPPQPRYKPKCTCGAAHTFTPQFHSEDCELYTPDQLYKKNQEK